MISSIVQGTSADGLIYEYYNMGNITKITRGTGENAKETSYVYDSMGQLIRVNDQTDTTSGNDGTTWVYVYDCGGNILSKTRYPYTTETPAAAGVTINYTYGKSGWKDQLTAYNGATIQYDNIGNPTDDGTWTYTWENGRQLKEMSKGTVGAEGYMKIEYLYNAEGLRIQKITTETTASGTTTTTTDYILHGKNIVHLTQGNHNVHFFYDASNKPAIVDFNGTKYGYVQNLQGDIIQIIDANGAVVVEYTYDAWGKVLSTTGSLASTLGTVQPFRYRGYVYDVETGLYYLRSRYYMPELNRFINLDSVFLNNMFSYCSNIPTNQADTDGHAPYDLFDSALEAMIDFADNYGCKEHEFGTALMRKRDERGQYFYTSPAEGTAYSVSTKSHFPTREEYVNNELIALAHTHANHIDDVGTYPPSREDLENISKLGYPIVVIAPDCSISYFYADKTSEGKTIYYGRVWKGPENLMNIGFDLDAYNLIKLMFETYEGIINQ